MYKHDKLICSWVTLMLLVASAFAYTPQYADSQKTIPIKWNKKLIKIEISTSLIKNPPNIKSLDKFTDVINRSLNQWQNSADIEFEFEFSDRKSVSPSGRFGDGVSLITIAQTPENILLFGDKANDVSAITRVFYDNEGNISEADIVLNPIQRFSTDGTIGTFDLEATLTHEIGHLLGLGHSKIIGSTMHNHQGKNGIYNLPSFSSRSISEDDKAGLISLYGRKKSDLNCCGAIDGKLNLKKSIPISEYHVWAEESDSGRVFAGVTTDSKGAFYLDGLSRGSYNLFVQPLHKGLLFSTVSLGEVSVDADEIVSFDRNIKLDVKKFNAKYIGLNGQLSTLAVPVNEGKSYLIYVGGKDFTLDDFEISFNSNYFQINKDSIKKHDYGDKISVLSFEVNVSKNAEFGEYSIKLINKANKIAYLVGGLTIGRVVNYWEL